MNSSTQINIPLIDCPSIIERLTKDTRDSRQYNLYLSLIIEPIKGWVISPSKLKGLFIFFLFNLKFN